MNGPSSPNILDYLDDDGEDIDLVAYDEAEKDYQYCLRKSRTNRGDNIVGAILVISFGT
jgi:hypothetical protein